MSARAPLWLILLLSAGTGWAYEFSYTATIPVGGDRINRPYEDLSNVYTSGGRGNVRYQLQSFIAPFSGVFTFLSVTSGNWDNFLVLYNGPFDDGRTLVNAVAANSSGPGDNPVTGPRTAGFTYTLIGGQQYYIATMGETNGQRGTFTNTVSTPEPGTWWMAAMAMTVGWWRRKTRCDA